MDTKKNADPEDEITITLTRSMASFFVDVYAISNRLRNNIILDKVAELKKGDPVSKGNALAEVILDLSKEKDEATAVLDQLARHGIVPKINPFG
ncbi:hypothetical protein ACFLTA_02490 [Bacteroidota bacterium]